MYVNYEYSCTSLTKQAAIFTVEETGLVYPLYVVGSIEPRHLQGSAVFTHAFITQNKDNRRVMSESDCTGSAGFKYN